MEHLDRIVLYESLRDLDLEAANSVLQTQTEIVPYPAPFLRRGGIWRVVEAGPYHPTAFYVGCVTGEPAYLLTGRPKEFQRLLRAEGWIETRAQAEACAVAYLETTHNGEGLFYLLRAASEARLLPSPTREEQARAKAFLERYGPVIAPPAATPAEDGFDVWLYAIRQQTLEQHIVRLTRACEVQARVRVLEKDLPLVWGT